MSDKRKLKVPQVRSSVRLGIDVEQVGGVTVVTLAGPVDSETLQRFEGSIKPLCASGDARVVIDCARLRYINSRGIGLLVQYHDQLVKQGGRLALCNLNTKVVRTFDLIGVGKRIPRFASIEAALEKLSLET